VTNFPTEAPRHPEGATPEAALSVDMAPAQLVGGAVRGAVILVGRNLGVQGLALLVTIPLARLLSPTQFGAFAVASAIQQVGIVIVNFGLPAALIRREVEPTVEELRAAAGLVLALGSAILLVACVVAFALLPALGQQLEVTKLAAVACASLPILGMQVAPVVRLNRELDFKGIAFIEVAEAIAFYATALVAAILGLGPYSLAGAVVVGAAVGMLTAFRISPWRGGFAIDLGPIRSLAAFGLQVGALQTATIVRELGLIALLAGIGGSAMAGFYGMARRLFSLPFAAMAALQRVGMTALAKLPRGPERTRQTANAVAVGMLAVGLPMALIAGAAEPMVSFAFGHRWLPAAHMAVIASAGVLLFAGAGTLVMSRRLADGDARSPLAGIVLQIAVLAALSAALVPDHGASGAGVAIGASFAVFTLALVATSAEDARAIAGPALRGLIVSALAALAGHLAQAGPDAVATAASLAVTAAVWLGLARLLSRRDLNLLTSLLRRYVRPASRTALSGT